MFGFAAYTGRCFQRLRSKANPPAQRLRSSQQAHGRDIIRRVYQLIEQSPKGFIRKTSNELPSKKKGRQCSLGTIDTLLLAMVAHENCCMAL
jgi:hypothetical protein